MVTRKDVLYSSFVGLPAELVNCSQRKLVGLKGTVIDETKNLVVLETGGGKQVRVPKVSATFRFTLENGETADVEGSRVAFRPHERPKKV